MIRAFQIPLRLRAKAALELRRRRQARSTAEDQTAFVVMPPLDPPPVPPEFLAEADGRDALVASRQSTLGALLEDWRKRQGVG